MRKGRVASTAGRIGLELSRAPAQLDRAADGRVTLLVCRADPVGVAVCTEEAGAGRVTRAHVGIELGGEVSQLGGAEAGLVGEIERAPGGGPRDGAPDRPRGG